MYLSKYHSGIYKGLAILFVILCHAAGTFFNGSIVLFTPLGGVGVADIPIYKAGNRTRIKAEERCRVRSCES